MNKTKPRFLKTNYKPPRRPNLDGRIDLYNPFTHKRDIEIKKNVEKSVKKQNKKFDLSGSDSSSDSSSDDEFKPEIREIPKRPPSNAKKESPTFNGFNIEYIPASKNDIPQRPAMKETIIPKHPFVCLVNGAIGSGKTNMLCNMLLNPSMYGKDKTGRPYWDEIFVFTNSHDEILEKLMEDDIIPKHNVKHVPDESDLKKVIKMQKAKVKASNGDFSKVPRLFFIFDDIIDSDLIKSSSFKTLCIRNRHMNASVFCLGQYFNAWPKQMRMQATNLMIFNGNLAERELICDVFAPSTMNKKDFNDTISFAWQPEEKNTHPFLHICRKEPIEKRFRKSLINVIDLESFKKN
jgi:hypothetical protein